MPTTLDQTGAAPASSAPRRLAAWACLALGALGAGCAGPTLVVQSAHLEASGPDHAQLGVSIDVANAAEEPLRLLQWDYTVHTPTGSYSGVWEALVTIPPGSSKVIQIPAVVPGSTFDPASRWTISGTVRYRSPDRVARILYDLEIHRPREGFSGPAPAGATAAAPASPPPEGDAAAVR